MELDHQFTVPTGVEETWAHFEDIASVAECFPGAAVTSVEGSTFQGTCKVKLGPIALVYTGSGTFTEKDEAAHRFVVDAKGKDKRGNGTAGATVTLGMVPAASGGTDVSVHTDLAITGKPAQFGRGVMQDVSDKLLGQFVACLEQRLGADAAAGGGEPSTAAAAGHPPDGRRRCRPCRRDRRVGTRGTCAHRRRPRSRTTRSTSARRCCRSWPGRTGSRALVFLLLLALVIFLLVR